MIDYSDFPMDKTYGIKPGEFVTGEALHDYLVTYALKWDVLRRVRFNTTVTGIEKDQSSSSGWLVSVFDAITATASVLKAQKLVISTGVTNNPYRPRFAGAEEFGAQVLHTADLGRETTWMMDPTVETVTVLGGGKSAYDAANMAASTGKKVEWVIRRSGKGPAWVFPALASLGPFKALREVCIYVRTQQFSINNNTEAHSSKTHIMFHSRHLGAKRWSQVAS